ncbi:MAG: 30S ribosome-binding factor RbfA [Alphaproteobacteria bacterium]|nr:30S ribosome-binding factor RbfA [Alphaproteobacteria bacterium]
MARAKAPTQRQLRVGEEIRHALAEVFERDGLRDPVLRGRIITVTEVRASPDLKNVTAFVTPLGGDDIVEVVTALKRASKFLRGEIGRRLRLRHIPNIVFEADTTFDQASYIDDLLRKPEVARDTIGFSTETDASFADQNSANGQNKEPDKNDG